MEVFGFIIMWRGMTLPCVNILIPSGNAFSVTAGLLWHGRRGHVVEAICPGFPDQKAFSSMPAWPWRPVDFALGAPGRGGEERRVDAGRTSDLLGRSGHLRKAPAMRVIRRFVPRVYILCV